MINHRAPGNAAAAGFFCAKNPCNVASHQRLVDPIARRFAENPGERRVIVSPWRTAPSAQLITMMIHPSAPFPLLFPSSDPLKNPDSDRIRLVSGNNRSPTLPAAKNSRRKKAPRCVSGKKAAFTRVTMRHARFIILLDGPFFSLPEDTPVGWTLARNVRSFFKDNIINASVCARREPLRVLVLPVN